jgi:integrase/recombinase XerD
MTNADLLGPWVRRFLLEYLVGERNVAANTRRSYRDTLRLVIPFIATATHTPLDRLRIDDLAADGVRQFLGHVEQVRGCRITTRNQRLAALHSLARYIGGRSPEHLAWCTEVCSIPFKKAPHEAVCYLEKPEMDALLEGCHAIAVSRWTKMSAARQQGHIFDSYTRSRRSVFPSSSRRGPERCNTLS